VHDREKVEYVPDNPEYYRRADLSQSSAEALPNGFEVVNVDRTQVRDIMTPVVFSVAPATPAYKVIEDMLARKVHRLFVVGSDGVLSGIISTVDVLRRLRPEEPAAETHQTAAPETAPRPLGYEPW
jgi:CBS domain-containing protein